MSSAIEQLKQLLFTGELENILLAETLAQGLRLDMKQEIRRMGLNPFGIYKPSDFVRVKHKQLQFPDSKVQQLAGLEQFSNIETLNFNQNAVKDLSPLAALARLRVLYCEKNRIDTFKGLETCSALEEIYANYNQIKDLSPLAQLPNLHTLHICDNQLDDLESVAGCQQLEILYFGGNRVRSLAPLRGMPMLTYLDISANPIESLSPLYELPHLYTLFVSELPHLDAAIAEFKQLRPNCQVLA